ncbi:MAG: hypothetical protein AAF670_16660 [Planctomycetota bacterium]
MNLGKRVGWIALLLMTAGGGGEVMAQNGNFLESLFRSLAEQQIRRETEPKQDDQRPPIPRRRNDSIGLPSPSSNGFPGGPLSGSPTRVRQHPNQSPLRPSDRSPTDGNPLRVTSDVRGLAGQLALFDQHLDGVLREMKQTARDDRAVAALLPEVYELQAQTQAMILACRTASSVDPLMDHYRELDRRWRALSFELRTLPSRSARLRDSIAAVDRDCRSLEQLYRLEPQYDVDALRDQMIIAATYMQSLLDDLQQARTSLESIRDLTLQGRRLRQALLDEAERVRPDEYEFVTSHLTDYVFRWRAYATRIAAIGDPVLDRRLVRIEQSAESSYAILWMSAPGADSSFPSASGVAFAIDEDLLADAASLDDLSDYFAADARRLRRYIQPARFGDALADSADEFHEAAERLHRTADRVDPSRRDLGPLRDAVAKMATAWQVLDSNLKVLAGQVGGDRRIASLTAHYREMMPLVGHLSAAFLTDR